MLYNTPYYPRFEQRPPSRRVDFGWITESFELFKQQAVIWIIATVILAFGPSIVNYPIVLLGNYFFGIQLTAPMYTLSDFASFYVREAPVMATEYVVGLFIVSFLYSGLLRLAIRQVRGEMVEASDIFRGLPNMMRLVGFSLIMFIANSVISLPIYVFLYEEFKGNPSRNEIIGLGAVFILMFLVIGTFGGLFLPASVLIADGEKVFRAMGRSFSALKNDWIRASLLLFLFGLIYTLSIIPCALGVFVTIPMGFLMLALVYRDMMEMPPPPDLFLQQSYGDSAAGVWPPPPTMLPDAGNMAPKKENDFPSEN